MKNDRNEILVDRRIPFEDLDLVAHAFDDIAETFDNTLENEITVRLRKRVYGVIEALAPAGSTILDINCGTGIDLLHLAEKEYEVYGTDISPAMVSVSQAKMLNHGFSSERIQVCAFHMLSPSVTPVCALAFSNFGGLNCTPDLAGVGKAIASVVRPGGYFVGVLMPPFSLWESASFAVRLRWKQVFRRFRKKVPATGFGAKSFSVHYHSVHSMRSAFSADFEIKQVIGLSILSPTPQSLQFEQRHPILTRVLLRCDRMIESVPLLRTWGDHYIVVFRRRQ